jgi:hypothetical protein
MATRCFHLAKERVIATINPALQGALGTAQVNGVVGPLLHIQGSNLFTYFFARVFLRARQSAP